MGTTTYLVVGSPIRKPSDHSLVIGSPRLIADSYVLHRFLVPRHPPCALKNLSHKNKDARVHCVILKQHTPNRSPTPHTRDQDLKVPPNKRKQRSFPHNPNSVSTLPPATTRTPPHHGQPRKGTNPVVLRHKQHQNNSTMIDDSTHEHTRPHIRRPQVYRSLERR